MAYMDLDTLEYEIDQLTEKFTAGLRQTDAEALGLDRRAGYRVYISTSVIAVSRGNSNVLEYYGGFEYVEADDKVVLGDLVVYRNDSDRVQECIDHYYESN